MATNVSYNTVELIS